MITRKDFDSMSCMFCGEKLEVNDDIQMIVPHYIEPTTIRCPMSFVTLLQYAQLLQRIKRSKED